MIRGWFVHLDGAGAEVAAVSWDADRQSWVNLTGKPISESLRLDARGPE